MTKKCFRCQRVLPLDYFQRNKAQKDGRQGYCKECRKKYDKRIPSQTYGTLECFRMRTWNNLNHRTVNGSCPSPVGGMKKYIAKGVKLLINKEEFYKWCEEQWDQCLFIFQQGEEPSIDRINDNLHYSLDNIQIISKKDNNKKGLNKKYKKLGKSINE